MQEFEVESRSNSAWITARALATSLIPGCVGRGVRLGSESSSGGRAGGVWKSGNLGIWRSGEGEIYNFWRSGDLEIQKLLRSGDLET